jgi:hypothetical protein
MSCGMVAFTGQVPSDLHADIPPMRITQIVDVVQCCSAEQYGGFSTTCVKKTLRYDPSQASIITSNLGIGGDFCTVVVCKKVFATR